MPTVNYKILFSGQVLENASLESAKSNLKKLLKADDATTEKLFSGKSFVIKKDLDRGQVDKYISVLNRAGLDVQVKPPLDEDISLDVEEQVEPPADTNPEAPRKSEAQARDPYSAPAAEELQAEVHCRQCGNKIGAKVSICNKCGARQLIGKPRSKVVAGLLAIFLGWIGAHRFYLGQWWGIAYIFFGIIAWLVAIVEGIVFLATPSEKWESKYSNVHGNVAVFLVVGLVVFVVVAGILAAIAIPAYHDYTLRAKVHAAMVTAHKTRDQLAHFMLSENAVPNSNREAGLPDEISGDYLSSIMVLPGAVLQATFQDENSQLNDKTIVWIPEFDGNRVSWDCSGGTLSRQFRPVECREGAYQGEQVPSNLKQFVSNDGTLELIVPKSWKPEKLGEGATVELANLFTEAYLQVYTEPKEQLPDFDLSSFGNAVVKLMTDNLVNPRHQYLGSTAVNGNPALHYRIKGTIDDIDLVYLVTAVEGKTNFYQVITWTLESRFTRNESDLKNVIASFKERGSGG